MPARRVCDESSRAPARSPQTAGECHCSGPDAASGASAGGGRRHLGYACGQLRTDVPRDGRQTRGPIQPDRVLVTATGLEEPNTHATLTPVSATRRGSVAHRRLPDCKRKMAAQLTFSSGRQRRGRNPIGYLPIPKVTSRCWRASTARKRRCSTRGGVLATSKEWPNEPAVVRHPVRVDRSEAIRPVHA